MVTPIPLFCAVPHEIFSNAYLSLAFFGSFFGNEKNEQSNLDTHNFQRLSL
jgi:hypothetical protein